MLCFVRYFKLTNAVQYFSKFTSISSKIEDEREWNQKPAQKDSLAATIDLKTWDHDYVADKLVRSSLL